MQTSHHKCSYSDVEGIIAVIYKSHKTRKLRRFFPTELFSFFALYQERIMGHYSLLSLLMPFFDALPFQCGSSSLEEETRIKETLQRHLNRLTVITIFISQQPAIEMSKRETLRQKKWKTLEASCQTIFHKGLSTSHS